MSVWTDEKFFGIRTVAIVYVAAIIFSRHSLANNIGMKSNFLGLEKNNHAMASRGDSHVAQQGKSLPESSLPEPDVVS